MTSQTRAPLGRNYVKLWLSSAVSNLGDGIGVVAWPWVASLLTRDPLAIALVAVGMRLPWALFSLPAGVITDRVDRRLLVLSMDFARVSILGVLALFVWLSLPLPDPSAGFPVTPLYYAVLCAAVAVGSAEVLRDNAAQTLMPAIVPKQRLEDANSRLWSIEILTNTLIGPPLAGLIIAISVPLAFGLNGLGFLVAALLVASISGRFSPKIVVKRSWTAELREGMTFLWRNRTLRDLALGLGAINALHQMMLISLVLFAQEILGLTAAGYGLVLAAGAVGGLMGGVFAARFIAWLGAAFGLRMTLAVLALQIGLIAGAGPVWIVAVGMVMGEFTAMIWNTITVSLRQRHIPDVLLGRVNSAYRFFGWGVMPIGILAGGVIVRTTEPWLGRDLALRAPFVVGCALAVILAVVMWRRVSPRRLDQTDWT
ncbi:MAG: MFS family permease [Paracoccaceae bacterium]|jgi:MFS family permease